MGLVQNNEEKLAEIIGIMLGDGCLHFDTRRKYQTVVAFSWREESYLQYVRSLFQGYFYPYKFCITDRKNEFLLRNTSIKIGEKLLALGIQSGDKIKNKQTIPKWLEKRNDLLPHTLRGLFDTDGCVYKKYGSYAQIQFKSACLALIKSINAALKELGFNPSKIQEDFNKRKNRSDWKIYLCRQDEIARFLKEIKPRNEKHILHYSVIKGESN